MVRVNKNVSKFFFIALLILTYIQLSHSRRKYVSKSSGSFGSWISSISFMPSKKSGDNTNSSTLKKWEYFPGGVIPPKGAPLPVKEIYGSNDQDYYTAQQLPETQSLGGYRLPPPPPPPPGFLNSPDTSGAPPSYTYNISYFYSRRPSDSNLTASFAMWEIRKHRSNYDLYSSVKHTSYTSIEKVPENKTLDPGEVYIVAPNNSECDIVSVEYKKINFYKISCKTNQDINITVILPNNTTKIIDCSHFVFHSQCIGSNIFNADEFVPVKYEVFNETKVYGVPLCNTTVVDGILAVNNAAESNNRTACIYPPYKWTGKKWVTIYEDEKKEKIKQNLNSVYNLTNLENNTLQALSHGTYFGKVFDLFTTKKDKE